jgi:hypothetical protein
MLSEYPESLEGFVHIYCPIWVPAVDNLGTYFPQFNSGWVNFEKLNYIPKKKRLFQRPRNLLSLKLLGSFS